MTPQPLEEYLKTCTDREYAEYIIATMTRGDSPLDFDKEQKEVIESIRSRQHPAHMGEISKICKLCNYERDYKEHDAQVARQAREEADGVQETAMRMYSLMVEVKQENTDEFMEYYEMRMHEFEKSLGIRSRTGGEPR